MATETTKLAVTTRTEKGKGAARRARRAGNVPAVLYGHGTDPQHLNLPSRDLAAILRSHGTNAIIDLDIEGKSQLALTKQIDVHPIRNYIEHVDLLVVKRGEKVTVDVNVIVEGEAAGGTLVVQDAGVIEIEADALSIPEQVVANVHDLPAGSAIHASDLELPKGVELVSDPDLLIVAVNEAPTAADIDAEVSEDAEEATSDEAPAESAE